MYKAAKINFQKSLKSAAGYSLLEVLCTLGVMGIVGAIAVNQIQDLDNPVLNAASQTIGFFKQVRARAISSTSAYRIYPASNAQIIAEYGESCSTTDTPDARMVSQLPDGAQLGATDWEVCYNSRGLPDANIQIEIKGSGESRTLEVFLGGAVKEL